ncbi:hypothetical protein LKL35_17620 [Streptomyces sp. ET3-23]|uniref:hypothetical protein n=1 Tax=Streptomyces sp. ET3-23 TaxID=2885643 RepID=UPI001D11D9EA|nr:hypothetical protein [Streptomyces sp. ET3-23]MCC2277223.1 hypothetical protein [Streptomyces sp. ET3-23]
MKKPLVLLAALCGVLAVGAAGFLFLVRPDGTAKSSDLVGSWYGSRGAELTLHEDGTLTAVNVPTSFSEDDEPIEPFTGKGAWRLEDKPEFGNQEIHLSLGEVFGSKIGVQVEIMGKGAQDGISIPISDDAGTRFTFKRSQR